jgi:transcriptional regulator with XRE-family HTH domain
MGRGVGAHAEGRGVANEAGEHRRPVVKGEISDPGLSRRELDRLLRERRAAARAARAAAQAEQRAKVAASLRSPTTDEDEVGAIVGALRAAIGTTLRSGRGLHQLSQRDLARRLAVSQSTVARLESGAGQPRMIDVVRALAAVGGRLSIAQPVLPSRLAGDHARDLGGRHLPAHLEVYRLFLPHSWWPGITDITMWGDEPTWSFRRR